MEFSQISAAKRRLAAHMGKETPFEAPKDKMDLTMWSENPLVICDLTVHTMCGECYGIMNQLHKAGLSRIKYVSEDEEFFSRSVPRWSSRSD